VDDGDKGRVVLAEEVRALGEVLQDPAPVRTGGEATACRVRVPADAGAPEAIAAARRLCAEHAGPVPVFVHVLEPTRECVVRSRGVTVDGSAELVAKLEAVLGPGAVVVEYAGRA
jgi:hypothetical protein